MINFPKDADNEYDKAIINGQTYYSFHAVQRDNPELQINGWLLKEITNLNDQEVWTIVTLGFIQIIFYHQDVWEEAYPNINYPE